MRCLDRHIDLKFEKLRSGWIIIHYHKSGVFGTKQVFSKDEIKEELIDIFHYLNNPFGSKMYNWKTSGAIKDDYDNC